MKSKVGRIFEISVFQPKATAPAAGYPILYVLDASTAFATLTDFVRTHEPLFGPVVVVGIGYASEAETANRRFDMSPRTDPRTMPAYLPGGWGPVGGADAFLSFLRDELKPNIEKSMSIDRSRQAIFGHSLGGLFVLHVMFTQPDSFDTYITGSPSAWWGNKVVMKELPAFKEMQMRTNTRRRLLITVGELESRMSPEELRAAAAMKLVNPEEVIRHANMVGNASALAGELEPLATHGLQVAFAQFAQETHSSVVPAYLARGARFALSGWFSE